VLVFGAETGVEITDTRWNYDVGILVSSIGGALMESPKRRHGRDQGSSIQ